MSDIRFSTENEDRTDVRTLPDKQEGIVREDQPERSGKRPGKRSETVSDRAAERVTKDRETVWATIELSGPFDEMLEYFDSTGSDSDHPTHLEDIVRDMDALLTAVEEQGGGIRSSLAREADLRVGEENIRCMLEMLRCYGLLELDQNTWVPGPEFERHRRGG